MVVKANTKLTKIGGGVYLLIPKNIFLDSTFPFKLGNGLSIENKDGALIVTKVKK